MTKIRFSTALQVIDAFPHVRDEFEGEPLNLAPVAFVQHLLQSKGEGKAVTFCAFLLTRHDALKWLCQSLRAQQTVYTAKDEALLAIAESWARTPSENIRQAALQAAMASGFRTAPAFAAAAVGWSGGNLSNSAENPVPPPAHMTGQAVKTGLILAALAAPMAEQANKLKQIVVLGLTFLDT